MAEQTRHLRVNNWREFPERVARGTLMTRRVFSAGDGNFESAFSFAQYNRLEPGGANETHIHDDIEKVYYVIQGECVVRCGEEEATVKAGDFFFLPVAVEHSLRNTGTVEAQMVVFAVNVGSGG